MGEPINLTEEERAGVRFYADQILDAVLNDYEIPPLRPGSSRDTDLVHLAVELRELRGQLGACREQVELLEQELAATRAELAPFLGECP